MAGVTAGLNVGIAGLVTGVADIDVDGGLLIFLANVVDERTSLGRKNRGTAKLLDGLSTSTSDWPLPLLLFRISPADC